MKTILRLKQCVLVLAASVAMTSCLKTEEDPFQIMGGGGYVKQEVRLTGIEESPISSKFYPIIFVSPNEIATKCDAKSPSGEPIIMTQLSGSYGVWITNTSLLMGLSKIPSGTFQVTGINQEGEAATYPLSINNTTEMKTKLVGSIKYEDKKIMAEFNKVENATDYFIVLKKSASLTLYESFILASYSSSKLEESKWKVTVDEGTFASNIANLEAGQYYLTIAAAITNSNAPVLYQESDIYDTFTK